MVQSLFHFGELAQVARNVVVGIPAPGTTGTALGPIKDLAEALAGIGLQEGPPQCPGLLGDLSQGLCVADHAVVVALSGSGKRSNGLCHLRRRLFDEVDQSSSRQEESFVSFSVKEERQ